MPVKARGLPSIFLGETQRTERKLPPVYLCETGPDGASCRLKWLASTCLAGMVGVCLIGVSIYASTNMADGSGMVSSIKRASLAALQPLRGATLANMGQAPSGQKEDRIETSSAGFATRHVIHDTVVERQGTREFITIKPYLRVVAGLATELTEDTTNLAPLQSLQALFRHDAGRRRRNPGRGATSDQRELRRRAEADSCRNPTASSFSLTRSTATSPMLPRPSPMPKARSPWTRRVLRAATRTRKLRCCISHRIALTARLPRRGSRPTPP